MTPGQRRALAALAVLLVAFGVSRLVHLTLLPMFIDEAVYIHWARRLATEGRLWRPMADGKTLQVALLAGVVPWARDALFWARAVSALVGGAGLVAAWSVARRLHGSRAAFFAAALYLVSPFALFHDRMVLADVYVSTAGALALLATLQVLDAPSRPRGVALGLCLAACALAKIPGLLLFSIPAFGAAFLPRRAGAGRAIAAAYVVAFVVSVVPVVYFFQNSAQVQEQAALGDEGETQQVVAAANLQTAARWLWVYWTPGICALGVVAFVAAGIRRDGPGLFLGAAALFPILVFALLSRSWFPRYVFPSTIPWLVLVGIALSRFAGQIAWLSRRRGPWLSLTIGALVAGALLGPALQFDLALITDPASAPFPDVDRFQYVEGWTAGYGRAETARRLRTELERSPGGIVVGVGGSDKHGWRPLHLLLRAALPADGRATLEVLDPGDAAARDALVGRSGGRPVYLAVSVDGRAALPPGPPLLEDVRADGSVTTALYRLLPQGGATQ